MSQAPSTANRHCALPDRLLGQIQGPARYIGAEVNAVVAASDDDRLRFALAYPDLYEVGMSHVGSQILYHIINLRDDALCERVYYPAPDAAEALRREGELLRTLETGRPVADCDILGITLQHELTYPTVLALLELCGLPLRASERRSGPLVVGGGPCALNPEPLGPFFDAFAIGDGEEVVGELITAYLANDGGREAVLRAWARLDGVYVPAHHGPGTPPVRCRVVRDLDSAPYPDAPVVPWVEVVHDRGQIEIARGCTRGCRFCQAGVIYRPRRERSVRTLLEQAEAIIANTGHDELSLVALNCADYSGIVELIDGLHERLADQRVSLGLPSSRVDSFSIALARKVSRVRKSGLTFAPEAGSQRVRDRINKQVTAEDLEQALKAAFGAGWTTIKLYFMIGLPGETDEDVQAIAELAEGALSLGRELLGPRAGRLRLNVSIACFVPKAHTPFQWGGQTPRVELRRRQELLASRLRDRRVKLSFHDAEQSVVEAALARGASWVSNVIERAYRLGATLDAWSEHFDFGRWEQAFAEAGTSADAEATRVFGRDEPLPWDRVDVGVSRSFLLAEANRALCGEVTADCRDAGCQGCGLEAMCAAIGSGEGNGQVAAR